jgi:hypothetical protein
MWVKNWSMLPIAKWVKRAPLSYDRQTLARRNLPQRCANSESGARLSPSIADRHDRSPVWHLWCQSDGSLALIDAKNQNWQNHWGKSTGY